MYYKSFFKRFLFRKNLFKKIKSKIHYYKRKALRSEYEDLRFLFDVANIEPAVIIDGGANIGFVTHEFHSRFNASKIYSIEPNPVVYAKLQESYLGNQNVVALNVGISRTPGKMTFNINANTGTSSFLEPNAYHGTHLAKKKAEAKEIETIGLDAFAEREGIKVLDILKLDIEGFELEALKGAEQLLKEQRVHAILLEVNLIESYVGQPLFHQIASHLIERDYHAFNTYGLHESKIRQAIITNFIFLSGDFRNILKEKFGNDCGW
jgi:FkbM family methyltransferase